MRALLDGARLLQVKGRSAEPIALDGQFLITRNIMKTAPEIKTLDGRPIVAVDEDGTRYFKRLQCFCQIAILESLNPDGTTASELLTFDDSLTAHGAMGSFSARSAVEPFGAESIPQMENFIFTGGESSCCPA